jgi:hypothetical protein
LREQVTADRVKAHFAEIVHGEVTRHELPMIGALNFVLTDALGGGVTRSLAFDAHGKGLSSAVLDIELPDTTDIVKTYVEIASGRILISTERLHPRTGHGVFRQCAAGAGRHPLDQDLIKIEKGRVVIPD